MIAGIIISLSLPYAGGPVFQPLVGFCLLLFFFCVYVESLTVVPSRTYVRFPLPLFLPCLRGWTSDDIFP